MQLGNCFLVPHCGAGCGSAVCSWKGAKTPEGGAGDSAASAAPKTSGGGVLDPALFGDARCAALRAAYAVVPGVSWGTAPAEAQTEWRTRGCDGMG